jgi:hypothetical protein
VTVVEMANAAVHELSFAELEDELSALASHL